MTRGNREVWLQQTDAELLASCRVDTYRASGPGGQKRNKTSSAVRLRHGPSNVSVIAEESRSQHENKARAIRRLRHAIALQIREPLPMDPAADEAPPTRDWQAVSLRNPQYPQILAYVLDVIACCGGKVSDAAALLNVTTAQLAKFVQRDGKLLACVNEMRRAAGLKPLHD